MTPEKQKQRKQGGIYLVVGILCGVAYFAMDATGAIPALLSFSMLILGVAGIILLVMSFLPEKTE
jgi:hypothetical protein